MAGDFGLLRLGPAAGVDFRIPNTPFSFSADVGAGLGALNINSTVTHGVSTVDAGRNTATLYASGLIAAHYALTPKMDVSLGVRGIWLADARIRGTSTTVGATTYSVRHEIEPGSALELGVRWKF